MAMYVTTGGSGSGVTVVNANTYNNIVLFTTPNVANTVYIVSVTWGAYDADIDGTGIFCLTPGAYGCVDSAALSTIPVMGGGPNIMKVGPNVAVTLSFSTYDEAGSVAWSYNYVGSIMDTN